MDRQDIPPTQKGRHYELRARGLREFAGLRRDDEPLDPFELARFAKLFVATFDMIEPLLSEETKAHLIGAGKDKWSGGAASQTLPDGRRLIILNPTHGKNRQNATLMEEVCHVFFGHKPSRLAIKNTTKSGETNARDYNERIAVVPSWIIAGMFNFEPAEFFEAEETAREDVKVSFGQ